MKLEDIRKLVEGATPSPWIAEIGETCTTVAPESLPYHIYFSRSLARPPDAYEMVKRDAAFIAASRDLVPKLLAVAEAARKIPGQVTHEETYNDYPVQIDVDVPGASELQAALAALEGSP